MSGDAGGVLLIYDAMDGVWAQPKPELLKYVYPEDPGQHIAYPASQAAAMERVVECACAFRLASAAKDERSAAQLRRDMFHATDNYLAHRPTPPSGERSKK